MRNARSVSERLDKLIEEANEKGRLILEMHQTRLTRRQLWVLEQMEKFEHEEDGEIVRGGGQAWIGDEQISSRTVNILLRNCAISYISDMGSKTEYFVINETGKELLRKARKIETPKHS